MVNPSSWRKHHAGNKSLVFWPCKAVPDKILGLLGCSSDHIFEAWWYSESCSEEPVSIDIKLGREEVRGMDQLTGHSL